MPPQPPYGAPNPVVSPTSPARGPSGDDGDPSGRRANDARNGGGAQGDAAGEPKLSPIKVTGQALAAITTAGVGAFVGGADGTVVGAALSSVVTTVGDAMYSRSLERTRDRIRTSIDRRRSPGSGPDGATPGDDRGTTAMPGAGATTALPPDGATRAMPGDGGATRAMPGNADATRAIPGDGSTSAMPSDRATRMMPADGPTRAHSAPPPPDDTPTQLLSADDGADGGPAPRRWGLRRYAMLAATAILIFLVSMIAITGIERVKGSPLSGGPPGTSVGSVFGTREATPTSTEPSEGSEPSSSADSPAQTTTSGSGETTGAERDSQDEQAPTTTTQRSRPGVVPTGLVPLN